MDDENKENKEQQMYEEWNQEIVQIKWKTRKWQKKIDELRKSIPEQIQELNSLIDNINHCKYDEFKLNQKIAKILGETKKIYYKV